MSDYKVEELGHVPGIGRMTKEQHKKHFSDLPFHDLRASAYDAEELGHVPGIGRMTKEQHKKYFSDLPFHEK